MRCVLGLTHRRDDATVPTLAQAIAARGGRLVRLDSDRFPTEARLDATLGPAGVRGALHTQDGERVALESLHAIWYRRRYIAHGLPRQALEPSVFRACWRESTAALIGVLSALPALQVDEPHAVERAENKLTQLREAARSGLQVPPFVVSNDADAVRAWAQGQGPLVTKMLAAGELDGPQGGPIRTAALTEAHLAELEGLELAPLTAQRRVQKVLEVRAVLVGDRTFAAGVDSRLAASAEVDWRRGARELMPHFRAVALPAPVEAALHVLRRRLGLHYGGADLILTPEGEWRFLELNPGGEWLWVQEAAGLDIAGALAELLLG